MNIWIIDHYSVPIGYYPLARQTNFAKYLQRMGHSVLIFAASSVHNSSVNLNEKGKKYKEMNVDGISYVLVKCHQYTGNGVKRILNMLEFAIKLPKVCGEYDKPDAILSTSMTLFACNAGLKLSQKYHCKKVAQITDLWPETIVAYGIASKNNPVIKLLRIYEKHIYKKADSIIFSMEGAYDYIIEQGWDKIIPREKVIFINNGVDLDNFNHSKSTYMIIDEDLDNSNIFKVIYTGSIRKVNNLGKLLDVAKEISNPNIRFLIWGDGDERTSLKKRVVDEKIQNVVFKGKVDKKYIPYIVSNADLNIVHNTASPLYRFGISFNKLFDYLAAGKPMVADFECKYNPMILGDAGIEVKTGDISEIAKAVVRMYELNDTEYQRYCINAFNTAKKYDFTVLTDTLVDILK